MKISRAIVLGLGSSGMSASLLLAREGASVRVLESSESDELKARTSELEAEGVEVLCGVEAIQKPHLMFSNGLLADVCVLSPGVPSDSKWAKAVESYGVPLSSELDVGFLRARCPVIAVTGSNGKSTLVKLLDDTINALGIKSIPCGNYGQPLSAAVMREDEPKRLVCEVSTFQMECSSLFAPQTGVLLNVQPNHLDRHQDMGTYADLKAQMFASMRADGVAIVNETELARVRRFNRDVRLISIGDSKTCDFHYADGKVIGKGFEIDVSGTFVDNPIMGLTASAALAVVVENGWATEVLEECIRGFVPLDFRMQPVGQIDDVAFINNSKSTTLASVAASLEMANGGIRLIAGGKLKEKDLGWIKKRLVKHVASAYVYGQAGSALAAAWSDSITCAVFDDLEQAMKQAFEDAQSGESVLLSPGCASFDQYSGYAERGRDFNRVLKELRR